MTTRSTLRAAEVALIDAATEYVLVSSVGSYTRLRNAVDAREQLGLASLGQPAFSNNSTDTSAEAGSSMLGHLGKLAHECYSEIAATYHNNGVGLTVDAIEQRLVRSHQTVSARVNELRNKGWITDSGIRRKTRSGRPAIVWTPTTSALRQT